MEFVAVKQVDNTFTTKILALLRIVSYKLKLERILCPQNRVS